MKGTITKDSAKILLDELLDFCDSECADFNLKAKDLEKHNLTQDELKQVMMAARKFWLDSEEDISITDCIDYSDSYIGLMRKASEK
jgi:hypothetical protein